MGLAAFNCSWNWIILSGDMPKNIRRYTFDLDSSSLRVKDFQNLIWKYFSTSIPAKCPVFGQWNTMEKTTISCVLVFFLSLCLCPNKSVFSPLMSWIWNFPHDRRCKTSSPARNGRKLGALAQIYACYLAHKRIDTLFYDTYQGTDQILKTKIEEKTTSNVHV